MSISEFEPYCWLFPPRYPGKLGSSLTVNKNLSNCDLNTSVEQSFKFRIYCGSTLKSLGPQTFREFSISLATLELQLVTRGGTAHNLPYLLD